MVYLKISTIYIYYPNGIVGTSKNGQNYEMVWPYRHVIAISKLIKIY